MKCVFLADKHFLVSSAILLANVYSSLDEHQQGRDFRSNQIRELKEKVKEGLSWTEVNGEIVQFTAHDHSHPRSSEIYDELDRLSAELIEHGYKFDSTIAFNFIQRPIPSIIQVTKNLRICGDCQVATKLIAKIRQRNIIIRDASRIHHFHSNGNCLCQDKPSSCTKQLFIDFVNNRQTNSNQYGIQTLPLDANFDQILQIEQNIFNKNEVNDKKFLVRALSKMIHFPNQPNP
ncbi:unnamed protein product, partial [Rotaria sp. Silwood2]